MSTPEISVVMAVFNGETVLCQTIDSILSQTFENFELIIIDDGSFDSTLHLVTRYRDKDSRIKILHQENSGLTSALIRGCNAATAPIIARHDVGDYSHRSRFERQYSELTRSPNAVMISCGTQFFAPNNELLNVVSISSFELNSGLSSINANEIRGPSHHGSTMFLRDAYEEVGGYRKSFYVAQDLDLWMRLFEVGHCMAMTEILYFAGMSPNSISAMRRSEQVFATQVIARCSSDRRSGGTDIETLREFENLLVKFPRKLNIFEIIYRRIKWYYHIQRRHNNRINNILNLFISILRKKNKLYK